MQMRPDLQIQSMLKAMNDVVLPALDPANPLAQEQARLCMGLLSVMAKQLPLQFRFDCDELARWLELAARIEGMEPVARLAPAALDALTQSSKSAALVLDRARADPAEVLAAVHALRAETSRVVRDACAKGGTGELAELESAVRETSRHQLLRDRSWLLGQGWEADPKAIPPIDSLLAPLKS